VGASQPSAPSRSDSEMHSMTMLLVSTIMLPSALALSVLSQPERAGRLLEADGLRLGSEELLQLGAEAKKQAPGALDNVKKMISQMIAHHQNAQAEDTDHKSFCDREVIASKSKIDKLKREMEKRNADQDLHSAKLAELKDRIADL